ncbi:MAG: hypothetical protein Q4B17_12055 [Lautropia sp.]|nr:hypothetical protein [Lautropia sp.]
MSFRSQYVRTPLAIALGMALAACGGESAGPGSGPGGADNRTDKATLSVKAPAGATGPIYEDPADRSVYIRGDLLIQALLSRGNGRDAKGQPMIAWLDAETYNNTQVGDGGAASTLHGPAALLSEDIQPDTANTGLGSHVAEIRLRQGPLHHPAHIQNEGSIRIRPFDQPSVRFGVSLPGLPKKGDGNQPPVTKALDIGQTLKIRIDKAYQLGATRPPQVDEMTLTSQAVTTIQPAEYHLMAGRSTSGRTWHHWNVGGDSRTFSSVKLETRYSRRAPNRFSSCIGFEKTYAENQVLCDEWEVPAGWTSGQPLTHVAQTLEESFFSELGGNVLSWNWSNRKGTAPVSPDGLTKTSASINDYGISGALLAAMFDAWTPRAAGMKALPAFAAATRGVLDASPATHNPARVSVYHESRASTYADGATDLGSHSPVVGNYLYAFRSGVWKSPTDARSPSREVSQNTMAMHLNHDPVTGLTLPRWAGLNELGIDHEGKQVWLYQGEQLSRDGGGKLIEPNDLILFGSTVQYWHDPVRYGEPKRLALLRLTIEKSSAEARSVDMCWTSSTGAGFNPARHCTTWVVPEGWTPGQVLKPQSYYAAANVGGKTVHWRTRVAR